MSEDYQTPRPTNLNRDSIFKIAESVADQTEFDPNTDLQALVYNMGGEVKLKDFWAEGSSEGGSLEVRKRDDFTIYVPFDTSEVRDRFTIAHELGHYILHYLWYVQVKNEDDFKLRASRYGSDRAEWEANWFASAFLLPEQSFRKAFEEGKSLGQISRDFNVSEQAAHIRAKALGINVKA
jgi:Zn-dependent peptidase ImmA (M78 family)